MSDFQTANASIQGPGLTHQTAFIDVSRWDTGTFTVHVAYDVTASSAVDPFHGAITAEPETFPKAPAAAQDSGPKVGYENYEAPGVLVPVTTTSAGGQVHSVEYMGRGAGDAHGPMLECRQIGEHAGARDERVAAPGEREAALEKQLLAAAPVCALV